MQTIGIIPARYASTRFPAKPLVQIAGKTMIQRVYEQCLLAKLDAVVVATDDERIAQEVLRFGGKVQMTSATHPSGTDRCAEVLAHFPEASWAINIQGDEPFIQPSQINLLVSLLHNDKEISIATLAKKIDNPEFIHNENNVKVVFNQQQKALYFSRAAIPFCRNTPREHWHERHDYYKHIGLYGFEAKTLRAIAKLPPSDLELAESLEQLRWLQAGYTIGIALTDIETIGIDTPEDLKKVLGLMDL